MTEQQVPKLAALFVEHQSELAKLSTADAQWVIQNPKEAMGLFIKAIHNSRPLLNSGGTVQVRPLDKFVASDYFKVNTQKNASAKIYWVGDNFREWFFDKIEETAVEDEVVLRYHTLSRDSADSPIIAALGGEARAETTLAQIFAFLQNYPQDEKKLRYMNIFYVRDVSGVLRVLSLFLDRSGWTVLADAVDSTDNSMERKRVFSRD